MESTYDILIHHGILGMKWGVRNGPPYPLKSSSRSTSKGSNINGLFSKGLSRKQVKNWVPEWSKIDDLPMKKESWTFDEDLKVVNKRKFGKLGYTNNCMYCVAAMEMRLRGYDVVSAPAQTGIPIPEYMKIFKGATIKTHIAFRDPSLSQDDNVSENIKFLEGTLSANYPAGSRGFVYFYYSGFHCGHIITWTIDNRGKVIFIDPQNGTRGREALGSLELSDQYYNYARLDDAEITDDVTKLVMSRKEKYG